MKKTKRVGWNTIQCEVPLHWEIIVTKENNLLIEENLKPLFEFMWFASIQTHPEKQLKKILQPFGDSLVEHKNSRISILPPDSSLKSTVFADRKTKKTILLVVTSKQHHFPLTVIKFHSQSSSYQNEFNTFIHSLSLQQQSSHLWAVQDFSFHLEADFTLTNHSFQAGLTRLSFQNKSTLFHFCRLAAAKTGCNKTIHRKSS